MTQVTHNKSKTTSYLCVKVAGGCDFVRKTVATFLPETASTTVLLDLLGYDAFPAMAALEAPSGDIFWGMSHTIDNKGVNKLNVLNAIGKKIN